MCLGSKLKQRINNNSVSLAVLLNKVNIEIRKEDLTVQKVLIILRDLVSCQNYLKGKVRQDWSFMNNNKVKIRYIN